MKRHYRRATAVGSVFVLGAFAAGVGIVAYMESVLIDFTESVSSEVTLKDPETGKTYSDPGEWAQARNLPISEAMEDSAADIDTLISMSADAPSPLPTTWEGIVDLEASGGELRAKANMSNSLLSDLNVDFCRVIEGMVQFPTNVTRAEALCDKLEAGNQADQTRVMWLFAGHHYKSECTEQFTTYTPGTPATRIALHRERPAKRTLSLTLLPSNALEAGDPDTLAAQEITDRLGARIDKEATKDACLVWNPNLADPVSLTTKGYEDYQSAEDQASPVQ